jgi:hypothetical protein
MSLTPPSHVILVPGADGRVFSEDSVLVHTSGIVTHPITSSRFGGIPSMPPPSQCAEIARLIPSTGQRIKQTTQ